MRIEWVVLARSLDGRGGAFDLGGAPVDAIWVASLPTELAVYALLRIVGTSDEFASRDLHDGEVNLAAPGQGLVGQLTFEFEPPTRQPGYREGWELVHLQPLAIIFEARAAGPYTLDFYINGRYAKSASFVVIEA